MIAEHDQAQYFVAMAWLQCLISVALLRNTVMCIHGSHSARKQAALHDRWVSVAEGHIPVAAHWDFPEQLIGNLCDQIYTQA